MHSVVIHAHFYQPPREDPWFEEIEREPDAEPYHDWTARVAAESYRGVVAARVLDGEGRIRRVVNALAYTSFDVGPSLLAWLARRMPTVHDAIVAADRESRARVGHGNALAHPYDHVVLPLLGRRDKVTTVRWGIADFVRRFGRAPEGMWLPETGVDDETLDVLAEQGIRFTVLAGHQVTDAPPDGAPGLYTTASGREIALFVYDGKRSADVAFGGLLRDGRRMAEQLAEETAPADGDSADSGRLVAIATDGETYGHHHRFGDMALAAAVDILERDRRVRLENFAAYLARHPATRPVGIVAPSAWSCGHGVDRWRLDCGCRVEPGTQQRWRAPLREAVDGLTADAHALFEREGPAVLGDPWAARDRYEAGENGERGPLPRGAPTPDASEVRARALLEMERHVLRANTSCAWFFDDLARPEPRIVLRAAARVIELAGLVDADAAREMERRLLERLARAESNDAGEGTGRDVYLRRARPTRPPAIRVAAGYAALRRFGADADAELPEAWSATVHGQHGHLVRLVQRRTGREWTFDVLVDVPGFATGAQHGRTGLTPPGSQPVVTEEHPVQGRSVPVRLADVDPRAITVLVRQTAHDGAPEAAPLGTALKLPDLPYRARQAVERAVRRAVVHRLLSEEEREQLEAGEAELAPLVSSALRRAVQTLATDTSPPAIARVLGLIDLRDSLRGVPPFDAQTLFHQVRSTASPEAAARLAPVARRLGFSPRAWSDDWASSELESSGLGTRDSGLGAEEPMERTDAGEATA